MHYPDHITPVLRQLQWLPVQRRVEFKTACLVHQSLASKVLMYLTADIQLVSEHSRRSIRSSSNRTLAVHGTRSSFGDRSFADVGPCLGNSSPTNLGQMTSYGHTFYVECGCVLIGSNSIQLKQRYYGCPRVASSSQFRPHLKSHSI